MEQVFIINLEPRIATDFSRFLPSDSREPRSSIGLHGIAAHSVVVSPLCPVSTICIALLDGRELVSVPVTKHCCLTVVSRCGCSVLPGLSSWRGVKTHEAYPFLSQAMNRRTYLNIAKTSLFNNSPFTGYYLSGIRESNPPPKLGKLMHYRCANAASFKTGAKVQFFFEMCKFFRCLFISNPVYLPFWRSMI